MRSTLARSAVTFWLLAAGAGCAAQTEPSEDAMDTARTALDDIVRLAGAQAPGERFDDALRSLRESYAKLGIPPLSTAPGATTTVTSAPPTTARPAPPSARPSPAELDRRQRDFGREQHAGPSLALKRWRDEMRQHLVTLEAHLQATVVDYPGVRSAADQIRTQLAQRPPPDAP